MLKLPKMAAKALVAAAPTTAYAKAAFARSAPAETHVLGQWMAHDQARMAAMPPRPPQHAINVAPAPKQVRFAPLPPKATPRRRFGRAPTIRIIDGVLEVGDDCAFGFSFPPRS